MKTFILAMLLLPVLSCKHDANDPASIEKGEIWSSVSRLERIAKDYAKQKKIKFAFEKADLNVSIQKRGTNVAATIWFFSGMGEPVFGVEVAPTGQVITNHTGIAVCGTGSDP